VVVVYVVVVDLDSVVDLLVANVVLKVVVVLLDVAKVVVLDVLKDVVY
jgi:hypothetical protein